jgi:ABC-type uncharacterized transport system permease subunit
VISARARVIAPLSTLLVQLGALCAALCLFACFLALVGAAPLAVFADMVDGAFGSSFSLQNSLVRAAPLMMTALCTALPARLGLVVIGNEGALLLGGLAAAACVGAFAPESSPFVALATMLLAGACAGALWIAIAAWLRQRRGINETICSLLMFYVALSLFLHLVEGPLRDPQSLNKPSTTPLPEALMLGLIPGTDVHWGLVFGVVACCLAYVLMDHSRFGFAARVVGGNLRTARLMGLPVGGLFLTTCALGGAAAGIAGATEVVAIHGSANASLYAGLGFSGILVAFVARQHPLAIIPVALLLGGIQASGGLLQRRHDLPDAAVEVFKGILFLTILASETYVSQLASWAQRGREVAASAKTAQPKDTSTAELETARASGVEVRIPVHEASGNGADSLGGAS